MHPKNRPLSRAEKVMLRRVRSLEAQGKPVILRGDCSSRIAFRLMRRGLLWASIHKMEDLQGGGRYPWAEMRVATTLDILRPQGVRGCLFPDDKMYRRTGRQRRHARQNRAEFLAACAKLDPISAAQGSS